MINLGASNGLKNFWVKQKSFDWFLMNQNLSGDRESEYKSKIMQGHREGVKGATVSRDLGLKKGPGKRARKTGFGPKFRGF
jgi:hypothetical protein